MTPEAAPAHRAAPPVFAFYISGHGFGHASRSIEIINAIGALAPSARLFIRTAATRWLFDVTLKAKAAIEGVACDIGVIQTDSLHLDPDATIREAARFQQGLDALADQEASFLRTVGACAVIGDIPPLAFVAARKAGVPSVAISNFAWDWIYEGYPDALAAQPDLVPSIRSAYRQATLLLRLPMRGGLDGWPCPTADLPFVARHATQEPGEVRRRLGIPGDGRLVLSSFGGLGISGMDLAPLAGLQGYTVVTTGHALGTRGTVPPGVTVLDDLDVYRSGMRYEDLVRAADVVVTKPGYGIIAECIANGTAILYTSRGHFVEYDVLVAEMPRYLRCHFIGHADLHHGRWQAHLDHLADLPPPPERPPTNGAVLAARALLRLADGEPAASVARGIALL